MEAPIKPAKVPGRVLAWASLLVALGASVAANVAFARPAAGPRLSAGVAPVLVVLAAGLLERVPLAGVKWWRRWLAYGGLSVVVLAAFVTSFEHQYRLLIQYGNARLSAVLLPVAVDGLIVLASVCLTVIADRRGRGAQPVAVPAWAILQPPAAPAATRDPERLSPSGHTLSMTADQGMSQYQRHDEDGAAQGRGPVADPRPVPAAATAPTGPVEAAPAPLDEPTGTRNVAARPVPQPVPAAEHVPDLPERTPSGGAAVERPRPARTARPDGRPVGRARGDEDLTAAARTVAGELTAAGRKVSRDALAAALRARGHRVGTDRAAALVRAVAP